MKLRPGFSGGRLFRVPIPRQLAPGRYRIFLRLYLDEYRVSDSYAWITDLP